jgi:hypothetical protein
MNPHVDTSKSVDYEKPKIIDLTTLTPVMGGDCTPTGSGYATNCTTGTGDQDVCSGDGNDAIFT